WPHPWWGGKSGRPPLPDVTRVATGKRGQRLRHEAWERKKRCTEQLGNLSLEPDGSLGRPPRRDRAPTERPSLRRQPSNTGLECWWPDTRTTIGLQDTTARSSPGPPQTYGLPYAGAAVSTTSIW